MNKFDDRNLQIYRKKYPEGDNYLITEDCKKAIHLTFNKLKVTVISIHDILKIF